MKKFDYNKLRNIINEAIDNVISNIDNELSDEELLLNANYNDIVIRDNIDMNEENNTYQKGIFKLYISINNKILDIDDLFFHAELKEKIDDFAYQLHIEIPSRLRQKGIATKLYAAFLRSYGDIVSLYSNRIETAGKFFNKEAEYDGSINKILFKVADLLNANIEKLKQPNGKTLGFIVSL